MVSIINITNGNKNLPVGIKIIIPTKYGYLEEGDSLYTTQAIIWMITILNLIDIKAALRRYEGNCMVYRPK